MKQTTLTAAVAELITLRDMVRWGASEFQAAQLYFGHGIDNAWDEALSLARYVLHLSPAEDGHAADARLLTTEKQRIAELFQRRILERKPAAYLTQEAWFAGLPFFVDERVIIPRSPLAELIETGFAPWLDNVDVNHVLDLCTGSGCIAIACAFAFPGAQIDAVDISPEALLVAKKNTQLHQVESAVHLTQSNLFNNLPPRQYDLIISNPPYVDAADMQALAPEYHHEPALALVGGADGLDLVIAILKKAKDYLKPQGILVVEVGNSAQALETRLPDMPFLWLEFKRGGHGVFLLTAQQLTDYFL